MHIKDYMNSLTPEARETFATEAGTTVGYINLLSCGARKPSPRLAKRLQDASGGKVTLAELRPDVYGDDILPERRRQPYRRRERRSNPE